MIDLKDTKTLAELPFSDHTLEMLSGIIHATRESVADSDELLPMVHLFSSATNHCDVVAGMFDSEKSKDQFAMVVRMKAREINADMSIFVSETWTLPHDKTVEYMQQKHKYPRGLMDHPDRIEIVFISIETHVAAWQGRALILREGERRRMGKVEFMDAKLSGRFASFLPHIKGH